MKTGKVLLGVLSGIVVGATIGILFAPDSGKNLRKKITNKSDEYSEGLEEQFNTFVESATQMLKKLKKEASNAGHNGNSLLENTKEIVKNAVK